MTTLRQIILASLWRVCAAKRRSVVELKRSERFSGRIRREFISVGFRTRKNDTYRDCWTRTRLSFRLQWKHYCINSCVHFWCGFSAFFPPAYFHFLGQSRLVCDVYTVGCVKEPVSSISRVPPSSTNTQCTSQTFYSRSSNTYRHPHIYETRVVSRQMYPWILLRRLWPLSDKRKPPFVRFCVSSSFFFILTIPFGRQDATQKR